MARPRTPASLKKGKSETKEHLEDRAELEEEIKGNDDILYSIVPDSLDKNGKQYYIFIREQLQDSKVLGNLDIPMLTQTANCLSKIDELNTIINENGTIFTIIDKFGNEVPKQHPAVSAYNTYMSQFRALATQLGLSPSARAQLTEMQMQNKEDLDDPILQALTND